MTNKAKRKGDAAEREACELLKKFTGYGKAEKDETTLRIY